jgi:hypothetical protein
MKVNRIIALRLMLSVAVIIGFASCSKIKFKSASRATGWNVDIKKLLVIKQVAGPGLILWREELYDG